MAENMKIEKILYKCCRHKPCTNIAIYEFTNDMEDGKGEYRTITVGYSCENHVEEVNKMLMKIYKEK